MKLGLSPEEIAERRNGVGGSDAGRIMNGEWRQLWREKTGRAEPEDLSGNLAVQMGTATEGFNALWYERVTGRAVTDRGLFVTGDRTATFPWMRANLDGITTTHRGDPAYWDAKHIGGRVEDAVIRYTPQMTHCAHLLALDWWVLSIFIGNSKHEIVEQEVDPFYLEELLAKEREFWGYVERDEEPLDTTATPAPKPTPALRRIYLDDVNQTKWPNWGGAMAEKCRAFANTHAAATAHAIVREEIKLLLPEDVGFVKRGLIEITRNKAGAVTIALKKEKDDG